MCHSGNISLLAIDFTDTLNGWFSGGNGNVSTTWDTLSHYVADYLFRIDFLDTAIGWAGAGTADSAMQLKPTDRGRNWIIKSVFPGSIYGSDSQKCWAVGLDINYNGLVFNTAEGSNNWNIQFTLPDSLNNWVVGGNLYTGTCAIYHTTNGGDTWVSQTSPNYFLFDVCFLDSLTGFAGGYATISKTTNGGSPWRTTYTHDNSILRNTVGTKIGFADPDEIYISCCHFDAISENPYISAPGADDKASGIAGVLKAVRFLSPYPFKATTKFIDCSGKEQGLLGSEAYAESAQTHGLDIKGVIELATIGHLDDSLFDDNCEPSARLFVQSCSTYASVTLYNPVAPRLVLGPPEADSDSDGRNLLSDSHFIHLKTQNKTKKP